MSHRDIITRLWTIVFVSETPFLLPDLGIPGGSQGWQVNQLGSALRLLS